MRKYAFNVKVIHANGFYTYVLSAPTQEEAEKLARAKEGEDVVLIITPLLH